MLLAAAVVLAVGVGSLGALLQHEEAEAAPTYMLDWMAATHERSGGWWYFCVGVRGHHNGAWDIFADADAPCYGPSSWMVAASTKGWSWGAALYLMGAAYQRWWGSCHSIQVEAIVYPSGPSKGKEVMAHSWRGTEGVHWHVIPLGSWSWEQASPVVGYTVANSPPCGWSGYHVHRKTDWVGAGVTLVQNPWLQPNTVYPMWNIWYYIHGWQW